MSTDSTPAEEPSDEAAPVSEVLPESVEAEAVADAEEPAESPEVPDTEVPSAELPALKIGSGPVDVFDPDFVPVMRGKVDRFGVSMGTGRRKTAVARVRITAGSGKFQVNGRLLDDYFCVERDREFVKAPLKLLGKEPSVDVSVRVTGGGTTGQTGAIVLGIGRALQGLHPNLHHQLSAAGYLTRDSRMVERKKYGLRKARRSFQFSKR